MAYSSIADLLNEFTPEELARLTGDPSGVLVNENRINYAIQNADELIDSFLRNRYTVPIEPPITSIINFISRELAISNLFEYANHYGMMPPSISRRRGYSLFLLRQIQNGEILLNLTEARQRGQIYTNKDKTNRLFNETTLEEFMEF